MRTNIDIDDALMAAAMAAGDFKTKKEAVEAGLRLLARRRIYSGLLSLRGKLHWDDSDEGWAQAQEGAEAEVPPALAVQEPRPRYASAARPASGRNAQPAKTARQATAKRSKRP